MMRITTVWAVLVAAAVFTSVCDGAALVRFINTVPTRTYQVSTGGLKSLQGRIVTDQYNIDRVGLQYFANSATSLNSPTEVWTEILNNRANVINGGGGLAAAGVAPYAWLFAMPPLRQYHTSVASGGSIVETAAVDRIATYLASQHGSGVDPSIGDNYEQTQYKADGVGLYLTFAAGTYRIQAYAVLGSATVSSVLTALPVQLTNTNTQVTLVDGHVYTIIAVGDGQYSASTPITGNTVTLSVIEESLAPTTFGMASLRWFHAINSRTTNSISVSVGGNVITAAPVAFGAVSSYVDVAPNSNFKMSLSASDATNTVIAPSSASGIETTSDVRAGLRATVICAVGDSQVGTIFCRLIPSRVVAYVRLINDLAAQDSLVQGDFGSDKLSSIGINLWASYEYPRPDQVVELSQTLGSNITPNHPLLGRGLFGVVTRVNTNTVTGYGEVWVPVFSMDFATRFTIIGDNTELGPVEGSNVGGSYTDGNPTSPATRKDNQQNPSVAGVNNQWFWAAPIFKRVNFIVKTSGGATLTGIQNTLNQPVRDVTTVASTLGAVQWYDNALLLDKYLEPGQYYTILATSPVIPAPTIPYVTKAIQTTSIVDYYLRLDRTVDMVSAGIRTTAGVVQAVISWIPAATQDFTGSSLTLRGKGNNNLVATPTLGAASASMVHAGLAGSTFVWNVPAVSVQTDANAYQYQFTAAATVTSICTQTIPSPNSVTLNQGDIVDVFVLNSFGCVINQNDVNRLIAYPALTQSAIVTGHANATLLSGATTNPNSPSFAFVSSAPASAAPAAMWCILSLLAAIIAALL